MDLPTIVMVIFQFAMLLRLPGRVGGTEYQTNRFGDLVENSPRKKPRLLVSEIGKKLLKKHGAKHGGSFRLQV
jgi:hypothetical protein